MSKAFFYLHVEPVLEVILSPVYSINNGGSFITGLLYALKKSVIVAVLWFFALGTGYRVVRPAIIYTFVSAWITYGLQSVFSKILRWKLKRTDGLTVFLSYELNVLRYVAPVVFFVLHIIFR